MDILSKLSQIQVDILLKAGARSSVIGDIDFKDLTEFSYQFVKDTIPSYLKVGNVTKIIELGCEELKKEVPAINEVDLVAFTLWLTDELKRIDEMEKDYLERMPTPDDIALGLDSFSIIGEMNVILTIAEKYGWELDYIWKLKYHEIFTIRLRQRLIEDYEMKKHKQLMKKK